MPDTALEAQRRLGSRRHRRVEAVNAVLVGLVVRDQRGAGQVYLQQPGVGVEQPHMQRLDRRTGVVDQPIGAGKFRPQLFGIEVCLEREVGHRRLLERFVLEVLLLVVCLQFLDRVLVAVSVDHIHLMVERSPGCRGSCEAGHRQRTGGRDHPARQGLEARKNPRLSPASPHQMGDCGESEGQTAPVEPQPPAERAAHAVTIHVRQRVRPGVAVQQHRMIVADVGERDGADKVDHHDPPADILVRAQRLDEHRKHRQQYHIDRARQDVPREVLVQLEIEIASRGLGKHRRDNGDQQGRQQHQRHGNGLGHHVGPARKRGAVDDLVELAVAVAPHQFAAVIDRDDHRDQPEAALQQGEQREGRRNGRGAVDLRPEQQGCAGVEQAHDQQHDERRAAQHLPHFERGGGAKPGEGRTFGPSRGQGGHRIRLRPGQLFRLLRQFARLARRHALLGKGEAPVGQRHSQGGEHKDHDPVEQDRPGKGRQLAVGLRRRPVPGFQRKRAQAQRVGESGKIAPFRFLRSDHVEGSVEHQEADHRDIGIHHRPGHGRRRKEQRAQQDHVRHGIEQVALGIERKPVRPQCLGVDPRHDRAEPDRYRHHQERRQSGQCRSRKAPDEIGKLAHLGGADHRPEPAFIVAHDHVGDECGGHEHEEQGQDQLRLQDRDRRVLVDVAAAADLDVVAGSGPEGQQEEDDQCNPEHRVAQLVTQFEARDLAEHGRSSLCRFGGGRGPSGSGKG